MSLYYVTMKVNKILEFGVIRSANKTKALEKAQEKLLSDDKPEEIEGSPEWSIDELPEEKGLEYLYPEENKFIPSIEFMNRRTFKSLRKKFKKIYKKK